MMKVFLGGTCNGSNWRDAIIPMLKDVDCFNPVVPEWNEEAYEREKHERETCDICLYVITPEMEGVYSIAEVVDDAHKRPTKVIFCILDGWNGHKFEKKIAKSLIATGRMVRALGVPVCKSIETTVRLINARAYADSELNEKI